MKKYLVSNEYKKQNLKRAVDRLDRRLSSKSKKKSKQRFISGPKEYSRAKRKHYPRIPQTNSFKPFPTAPPDMRLIENTEGCLAFFRDIRSDDYLSRRGSIKFVIMSLKEVTDIDYGCISILTSINDEFKYKRIILRTILPDKEECRNFMIESGYLNNLFDEHGKPFPKSEKSEMIFFEKGGGVLSNEDNRKISQLVKNVVEHLTGVSKYSLPVKTVILEICGNSIEWSGTESQQWLLGVKYHDHSVVFTVTDVGKGILETLYRKFSNKFFDTFKSRDEVLMGAFQQKYGSTTKEVNRNKGLPAVKANYDQGTIKNLVVLTNNVILHFGNSDMSKTLERGSARFKGTYYQWEMNNDCLQKLMN